MNTRHARLAMPLALSLLVLARAPATALDFGVGGFFGNQGLPWEGEAPLAYDQYPANLWGYGFEATAAETFSDGLTLVMSYETDPVLRNVVKGIITYDSGLTSIFAGPMLGTFNTRQTPLKGGISIGFGLDVPGIAFMSIQADSSMGAGIVNEGDYVQERSEIEAGFYAYNAICTASMLMKKYTRMLASGYPLIDASTRYGFSVDVFKKNRPYRVLASMAYQDESRTYKGSGPTTVDRLGAVLLGMDVHAAVMPSVVLVAGLESGVYTFGLDALAGRGPAVNAFMFTAKLGMTLSLDTRKAGPASTEEPAE